MVSNLVSLQAYVKPELKERLKSEAEARKISLSEMTDLIITLHYAEKKE